ncbi:MAG: nitrite reductase small subunit NirD [Pseudomonadota bacterium]
MNVHAKIMPAELWVDIGALEDIPVRGARVIRSKAGCVALFRTGEDSVFAIDDTCPHKKGPLSEGIVHGKSVTCPLHNWVISLETGQVAAPDEGKVRTYPTRVQDGRILVNAAAMTGPA